MKQPEKSYMKPSDDLKDWSKNDLVRELRRLRAILHEHAEQPGDDPRQQSTDGAIIDVAGDPHASGGAILDSRASVILDGMEVVLVDTKHRDDPVAMFMTLRGRVNYSEDRIEHVYLFGPDGAAALVSEIIGLAARAFSSSLEHGKRFGKEFQELLDERLQDMP